MSDKIIDGGPASPDPLASAYRVAYTERKLPMTISVIYNHSELRLIDHVAADLGLVQGQRINEAQCWQAIAVNAAAGIAACQLAMLVGDAPPTA